MTGPAFALFDTALGDCAIAWGAAGIVCVQLPEADMARTRARLRRRLREAVETTPPTAVAVTAKAIAALLAGEASDLTNAKLDMAGVPEFHRRVYDIARTVRPGATLTYGDIAARLGEPGAARAVGQALGRNPFPIIVPCHRVVAAGGKLGGFSARGGSATKARLLAIEARHAHATPMLFDELPWAAAPGRAGSL
jgi:methylated-DNA-[protein]-cysteine S-methyltransferase